jgi:nucleoside-diphosphate kinase
MAGNITLTIIKPSAFRSNYTGRILGYIENAGFRISAIRSLKMSADDAKEFYKVHAGKPFYEELVRFMSSGPVIAAVLEKDNAVEEFRKLIGSTDPAQAAEGTIRKLYGKSISDNAVHGSDSDENAAVEAGFFFKTDQRF